MPGTANDLNISESGYVTFDGTSVFHGRTFQAGTGITITNGNGVSGNTTIASTASLTDLHTARFIVASSTNGTGANFTTIASAIASAQGTGIPSTIFIQPGTYTENFSLPANINLAAYSCDWLTPTVTIVGKISCSDAGTRSISGICLQTNSDNFLAVTGSVATIINLNNCFLNCSNNTGLSFTSSSASAEVNIRFCLADIATTGIALFSHSSAGTLNIQYFRVNNSGGSSTASTCSAGAINFRYALIAHTFTTSGNCTFNSKFSTFGSGNNTAVTHGSSVAGLIIYGEITSGTASAISVSGGSSLTVNDCIITSSNTNAITGAGALIYSGLFFNGSSSTINTTTQTGGTIQGGVAQAPSAGFIGERIENTATSVAVTSATPKTITSISLTAGVWDVYALATTIATGGTAVAQAFVVNISTTDNTVVGTAGIQTFQTNITGGMTVLSGSVPAYRVTLTATTTYYLVCNVIYTSTTSPTTGRLSATRVG